MLYLRNFAVPLWQIAQTSCPVPNKSAVTVLVFTH
uniref:Uncharacterized protein n=1 Tax=Arundo donax TaxID=35708 RepID=A0A0A9GT98_ARUDO